MPVKDPTHWKVNEDNPCHYHDPALDRYAATVRHIATRRILYGLNIQKVLDVGCGDGQFGAWLRKAIGCKVVGTDAFQYKAVKDNLPLFYQADSEELAESGSVLRNVTLILQPDLAMCVTSLPFMQNWQKTVAGLCSLVPRVLVIENLQTPTPPWQQNMPEKTPIEYPELISVFQDNGFAVERSMTINVLDRRAFMPFSPRFYPAIVPLAICADVVLSWFVPPQRARYAAVLFRKSKPRTDDKSSAAANPTLPARWQS